MYDPGPLQLCTQKLTKTSTEIRKLVDQKCQKKGRRILICDDDNFERKLIRRILEPAGYTVVEASSGQEVLDCLTINDIGFLITDLQMPTVSGMDIIEAMEGNDKIGVMVITGMPDDDEMVQEITSRNIPFLSKPYEGPDLLRIVVDYFGEPAAMDAE